MTDNIEGYPLCWPEVMPRTKNPKRSNFKGSFADIRDGLLREIYLLGGKLPIISSNIPLKRDGMPYAGQKEPNDSGVAVYFQLKGKPMMFACDKYNLVKDNMRAIQKTIEAMRGIERWGVSEALERVFTGFEALPAPKKWWDILSVSKEATKSEIKKAYQDLAKKHHPDHGGDPAQMSEINVAYQKALDQ